MKKDRQGIIGVTAAMASVGAFLLLAALPSGEVMSGLQQFLTMPWA